MAMSTEEIGKELAVELKSFQEEKQVSQSLVARSIGISESALSLWQTQNYKGNIAKINEAVKSYLTRERDKEEFDNIEFKFVMTAPAREMFEIIRLCHLDNEFGVIYGPPGSGKTCTVREYARINFDVILLEVDPGWSEKILIKKIHMKIGLDGRGRTDDMMAEIVAKLQGSGRLLIIDEAENLSSEVINLVRRIHDHAGVGLLLIGMPRLIYNLRGRKGELAQLYSRSGASYSVHLLKLSDTEEIVKKHIPQSTQGNVTETFHDECGGNARVLSKLMLRSLRFSQIAKTPITPEIIKQAKMFITV